MKFENKIPELKLTHDYEVLKAQLDNFGNEDYYIGEEHEDVHLYEIDGIIFRLARKPFKLEIASRENYNNGVMRDVIVEFQKEFGTVKETSALESILKCIATKIVIRDVQDKIIEAINDGI